MKTRFVCIALVCAAATFSPLARAQEATPPPPATRPDALPAADAADRIRTLLAQVTNAAVSHNGFSELAKYLFIAPGEFHNYDDLNQAVDLLQRDWRMRFSSEFDINNANTADVYSQEFELAPAPGGQSSSTPLAQVTFEESIDQPQVTVLVSEVDGGQWKIGKGIQIDEQILHDALLKQLNTLHDQRDNWPPSPTQAYRAISARIILAIAHASEQTAQQNAADANQ